MLTWLTKHWRSVQDRTQLLEELGRQFPLAGLYDPATC